MLVISTSLNPNSRSRAMALVAYEHLQAAGVESEWIDLCDHPLPLCDGGAAYGAQYVAALSTKILNAKGVILASAIYNYDINAAAKNLFELTGRNWTGKVVGLIVAAGGQGSYMAPASAMASLMLDFRCVVVPRFVYGTGQGFEGCTLTDEDLRQRIFQLADTTLKFAHALDGLTEKPPVS